MQKASSVPHYDTYLVLSETLGSELHHAAEVLSQVNQHASRHSCVNFDQCHSKVLPQRRDGVKMPDGQDRWPSGRMVFRFNNFETRLNEANGSCLSQRTNALIC